MKEYFLKNTNEISDTLEKTTRVSDKLVIPYGQIKPCVAKIIEDGLYKGSFPNRNVGGLIIASELRRIGKSVEEVVVRLREWNYKNKPSLRISQLNSVVKSAFGKEYKYSCNSEFLKSSCVGVDFCSFGKGFTKFRKYNLNRTFLDVGWQLILSNSAKDIYYIALPELERRLGVGAGGVIMANYIRIAYFAGITPKSIKKGLLELKEAGLLARCVIGVSRKWERKATEIQRVIPIPRPPENLLKERKNYYELN
jgi:hypothetical protein